MSGIKMFRYMQPYFYSGLLDDPVLVINVRSTGRSIMIDCGQIHHLAKRVLRSVDAIFISHAHMDHFMGIDHFIRNVHVAPRSIDLFGPPGIADRFSHKISAYDWNLVEENWCTFQVYEIHRTHLDHYEFAGSQGFRKQQRQTILRHDPTVYRNSHLTVEADLCNHWIPSMIFRVTERESFAIDKQRLEAKGLLPGPWLKEMQRRFHHDAWKGDPIEVWRPGTDGPVASYVADPKALYLDIRRELTAPSIGYISDQGYTDMNRERARKLLYGVSLLFSECTFLAEDQDKARISAHLCTTDLNKLTDELRPDYLLPMHLSKAYIKRPLDLYQELALPSGTRLLEIPVYLTPRPLLPRELPVPGCQR